MKKENKTSVETTQSNLPNFNSHPTEWGPMPVGFTNGDVFFNSETGSEPPNSVREEEVPSQASHPILNSKIAKDAPVPAGSSPVHKLVPPPPPVTFLATPPPNLSPAPVETPYKTDETPYQYPDLEDEEDPGSEYNDAHLEETQQNGTNPPLESIESPAESKQVTPPSSMNQIGKMFKQAKGIVELPLTNIKTDFFGSLCVPVEEGHSVVLLLLAKQVETGSRDIKITANGLWLDDEDVGNTTHLRADVACVTDIAAKLQGDIAKDGSLIEEVISFLSGTNLKILMPRAKIEAVKGPGGTIIGYFDGESLVQFIVTVALVADGSVIHYLDLPFPAILDGGVETYLLPNTADIGDFVRYLAAKNSVGWQGQKTRAIRHRILDKQHTLGRSLTWGGSAVVAYAFTAGLLGAFLPDFALSLSLLAPAFLGAVIVGSVQLWSKVKRDMTAMHLALAHRTSWRLVNFARDQVDRTTAKLQGSFKRQFLGEMCPQDLLDTITKLGKTPPAELESNPQMYNEVTTAAGYALGPQAGADKKQLTDALAHAITEVKQKRIGGVAKVVISVARARMQAVLVKAGKVSPNDIIPTMSLDDLIPSFISRLKNPLPTSISVPLLDLEKQVMAGNPVTRDQLSKAIAAATALVERTEHFWAGKQPNPVKEVPYTKASATVVGEDFDNNFG